MLSPSPVDQLRGRATLLRSLATSLAKHVRITDLNKEERQRQHQAKIWGDESSFIVCHAQPYLWSALCADGQRYQQELHEEYERFRGIVRVMVRKRVDRIQQQFREADRTVSQFIAQDVAGSNTVAEELASVLNAVDAMLTLVADGEPASDLRPILIPDTNALIFNPQLDAWAFAEFEKFRLLITPTILQELDQLKVTGRAEGLREKAERLIRQMKEYQRRGPLHLGVTIRSGRSELFALAIEPDMSETLPWLRETNADDRLIASTFEVMRLYRYSPVVLVTRDINVQNKANFAGVPFMEPPDPPLPP